MSQQEKTLLETLLISPSNSEKRGEFIDINEVNSQGNAACANCNGSCQHGGCKG